MQGILAHADIVGVIARAALEDAAHAVLSASCTALHLRLHGPGVVVSVRRQSRTSGYQASHRVVILGPERVMGSVPLHLRGPSVAVSEEARGGCRRVPRRGLPLPPPRRGGRGGGAVTGGAPA